MPQTAESGQCVKTKEDCKTCNHCHYVARIRKNSRDYFNQNKRKTDRINKKILLKGSIC